MKRVYDYLFVTHLPAFYKVNLYNEIAKSYRVLVIFIASSSKIRSEDFTKNTYLFDYHIVNRGNFESRFIVSSIFKLWIKWRTLSYQKIVVGGWDLLEYWCLIGLSPKNKNALALESSVLESATKGFKAKLKKLFLSRIETVFASGEPHLGLLEKIGYQGNARKTLGVGIFHYGATPREAKQSKIFQGKFLYVGRLASEKNLLTLCKVFSELPQFSLTMIGEGALKEVLSAQAPDNVTLIGHVPNQVLGDFYSQHDMFILPSYQEPWGLVVEEALYYGLPVVVSNRVGCAVDLVQAYEAGVLFDPYSPSSLKSAILWGIEHYKELLEKVKRIHFFQRDKTQVQQYLDFIG